MHYIRCDSLGARSKNFTMLNGIKTSYSDVLPLPLVFDPELLYYLWDLTYRWHSTDCIYSMLLLVDGMCI